MAGDALASFFLEFDHRVQGKTPDEAFRVVEAWLRAQNAKVTDSAPPTRIVASHGRALQPLGWRKDARKTIEFELRPVDGDVAVQVRITPAALNATDVRMRSDEARANWSELLAELWVWTGEARAVVDAERVPTVDWNESLRRGRGMLLSSLVLFIIGIAILVLFFPSNLMVLGTGFLVAGALSLVYGGMTVRSARARLRAGPPTRRT